MEMEIDEEVEDGIAYYPPTKRPNKNRKTFNFKLFQQLDSEVEKPIKFALEKFYGEVLIDFCKFLAAPSSVRLPTLIARGQCIDWDWLIGEVQARNPEVRIEQPALETHKIDDVFNNLKKDQKFLLIVHEKFCTTFNCRMLFDRMSGRDNVYLALITSSTFSKVYEFLSRQMITRMEISKIMLPACDNFVPVLFDEAIPLGFLAKAGIHFHGNTLSHLQRQFLYEERSLANLRKSLALALHDFVANDKKLPDKSQRKEMNNQMATYSVLLTAFVKLFDKIEERFDLHCKVQSNSGYFPSFYNEMKEKHLNVWSTDKWRVKLTELKSSLINGVVPSQYQAQCKVLLAKLGKDQIVAEENQPPKQKGTSAIRRIGGPRQQSKFEADAAKREIILKNLQKKLRAEFRQELIAFLDSIFLAHIHKFPDQFMAGSDELCALLLSPTLSGEIDAKLGELAKEVTQIGEGKQLDLVLAYSLLVNHNMDSFTISMESLWQSFKQMTKPISGIEPRARFMAAVAQLEHIGAVKMGATGSGMVRLIYLPGAALTSNLFDNKAN